MKYIHFQGKKNIFGCISRIVGMRIKGIITNKGFIFQIQELISDILLNIRLKIIDKERRLRIKKGKADRVDYLTEAIDKLPVMDKGAFLGCTYAEACKQENK